MVLLELATGKPGVIPARDGQPRTFLAEWARQLVKGPELRQRDKADSGLSSEGQAQRAIETLAESHLTQENIPLCYREALFLLGARCVTLERKARPTIGEVWVFLRELVQLVQQYRSNANSASNLGGSLDIGSFFQAKQASMRQAASSSAEDITTPQRPAMHDVTRSPRASTTLQEFTSAELASATSEFADGRIVGPWRFGTVYEGMISTHEDGNGGLGGQTCVAVKLFSLKNFCLPKNKIQRWGELHHPHVEGLLGFGYTGGGTTALVHESYPNGSLDSHLFGDSNPCSILTWTQRVSIAFDAAKGLEYLHLNDVIHGDPSACNILLQSDFRAKLSDYMSFQEDDIDPSTGDVTPGHTASKHKQSGRPTLASDVYKFGILLLELLSGCRARDLDGGRLVLWLSISFGAPHELRSLLDERLEEYSHDGAVRVAELFRSCCQEDVGSQPSMSEVVQVLAGAQAAAERPVVEAHNTGPALPEVAPSGEEEKKLKGSRFGKLSKATREGLFFQKKKT